MATSYQSAPKFVVIISRGCNESNHCTGVAADLHQVVVDVLLSLELGHDTLMV